MTVAYFDCFAGISGDMILGALLDLGLPLEVLERELGKLPLEGYRLQVSRVNKLGVMATKVDVMLLEPGGERPADSQYQEVQPHHHSHRQVAPHTHHHDHTHTHDHTHDHTHTHDDHHQPHQHRGLAEILGLIAGSDLAPAVQDLAIRIFQRLGQAESGVHGVPVESIHFHEVGATDAIVDVVGCAIGIHHLGIEAIHASPVHLGQGMIRMAHGLYPIPGPATASLLVGVPTYQTEIRGELTTPTGAAILTTLAGSYGPMPPMTIRRVGYGAGHKDREIPNVLRVVLGEPAAASLPSSSLLPSPLTPPAAAGANLGTHPDQHLAPPGPAGYHQGPAVMVETNIDDMNPQLFDYLFERLTDAGAMDVSLSQVLMKKNRPAAVLHVLTSADRLDEILRVIFTETTTIGVRTFDVTKRMLQRELQTVATEYGPIRVKVCRLGEQVVNLKPEYDDCKAAARVHRVPLKEVEQRAREAARFGEFPGC